MRKAGAQGGHSHGLGHQGWVSASSKFPEGCTSTSLMLLLTDLHHQGSAVHHDLCVALFSSNSFS